MKKLRLLLTKYCNRKCPGCCNNDWDIEGLNIVTDFTPFEEIYITGGEPLLKPKLLKKTIKKIRSETMAKVFVYTAKTDRKHLLKSILKLVDGLTVTLHESRDIGSFVKFSKKVKYLTASKSLRLNIFKGNETPKVEGWKIKNNIVWIKNCPLPEGEVLGKLRNEEDCDYDIGFDNRYPYSGRPPHDPT
jgi:molybdenum cofactor biosynthesis enzyme MoaA